MRKSRKQQQRLLRNMSAHAVVLELLQIPYEKVGGAWAWAGPGWGGPGGGRGQLGSHADCGDSKAVSETD